MGDSQFNLSNVRAVAISKLEPADIFSFLWQIENYSKITKGEDPTFKLTSAILHGGPRSNHTWKLMVHPQKTINGIAYFAVYLGLVEFGDGNEAPGRKLKVDLTFSLLDKSDTPCFSKSGWKSYGIGDGLGFSKFLPSTQLTEVDNQYLINDTLKVHCQVSIQGNLLQQTVQGNGRMLANEEKTEKRNLKFEKMYQDGDLTDLLVQTPTVAFKAHKVFLAAASPVFAAMFTTDMLEKESGTVSIMDFEDDVVKAMLDYIYQGEIKLVDIDKVPNLLMAADKYDLPDLKSGCENLLVKYMTLTPATALKHLDFAVSNNATKFKEYVVGYIKRNFDAVKETPGFKNLLKSPVLSYII